MPNERNAQIRTIDSQYLWCRRGTADKVYNIFIKGPPAGPQDRQAYSVYVEYGRRGSVLKSEFKLQNVAYDRAFKEYDSLIREKTSNKKGYIRFEEAFNNPNHRIVNLPLDEDGDVIMDIEDAVQTKKVVKFRPAAKKAKPVKPPIPDAEIQVEPERKLRFGAL